MKAKKQISTAFLLFFALFLLLGAMVHAKSTAPMDKSEGQRIVLCSSETEDTAPTYFIERGQQTFVARDALNALYAERDTLTALVSALPEARLIFRNVSSEAPLTISRSFSISGELTIPALLIEGGASVVMDGGVLHGELSVRSGSFLLSNGEIVYEKGSAVTLDYMASAVFHMLGGRVYSTKSPAIYAPVGSVMIGGGTVESTGECAIFSSATLTLYDSPVISAKQYGIESTRALHLSHGAKAFQGKVSVRMNAVYEKGSFSVIAYGADAEAPARITLFDKDGKGVSLSYFEQSEKSKDENILAVALPYEISFSSEGTVFEKLSLYDGDTIVVPIAPMREGFRFVSYRGEQGASAVPSHAEGDAVFYADYELLAPTLSLSDLSFVYDGTSHLLAPEDLSHPLMREGYFSYTWYFNGEMLRESSPTLSVKNTSQSGRYRVLVTFTYKTESVSAESEEISLEILPMTVSAPTVADKVYDGTHLYATVSSSPYYTVKKNEGGVGAGSYEVSLKLTDPENTVWQGADTDTLTVCFFIRRAQNKWLSDCWARDAFLGKMPEFGGHGAFGESVIEYAKAESGPYSAVLPGTAGTYYVRIRIVGCENYTELVSDPIRIEIQENKVVSIRIDTMPQRVSYTAFETVDLTGICISATYLDGGVLPVDERAVHIIYDSYTSYLGGEDSGVTLVYGDARARLPLTVKRACFDLSNFSFSDLTATYSGTSISILPMGQLPMGRDGARLCYRVEGEGVNVGSYQIQLFFSCESKNYEIPATQSATLTIQPKEVEIVWNMLTFVYDGSEKKPTASFVNVYGENISATVSGEQINAGMSYRATASEPSGNYTFQNPNASFSIEKASYDTSGAYWSAENFVYDGTKKKLLLLGLPDGVTVSGYDGNEATDAGEYTARAVLSYDELNYHAPSMDAFCWQILRAEYDLSGFEVKGGGFQYDGQEHFPLTSGILPKGHDGIAPTFSFSDGVRNVSEGKCTVEIVFHTESKNYAIPTSLFVELWITPAPISVEWSELSYVYDGEKHLPTATHPTLAISVGGEGVNAGEYVATATASDPNYYITNAKISYVIQKAKNEWTEPLSVKNIFTSGTPLCSAKPKHGEVVYLFYGEDGQLTQSPQSRAGVYYCVATVRESDNYLALSSERCRFLVQQVLPKALDASVNAEACIAYRTLSPEEISVILVYNDGTREPVLDYAVIYENGSSLRCKDTALSVTYADFSVSIPISVSPATLRAEDVILSQQRAVYSGEEIHLTVFSAPDGVSFLGMEAPVLCGAGEYEILVHFALDEENYEGSGTVSCRFVIAKKEIALPSLPDMVYKGTPYELPDFSSSEYVIVDEATECGAGEHFLTLKVKDEANTCFPDGEAEAAVSYRITRAPLTVKLCELTVYADGYYDAPTYEITDGVLYSGDSLFFTPILGNTVGGIFENENYEITVIEGSLIQSELASPDHQEKTLRRFFLSVGLLLLLLLVFSRRKRIHVYLKAHAKHRKTKAKSPISAGTSAQASGSAVTEPSGVGASVYGTLVTDSSLTTAPVLPAGIAAAIAPSQPTVMALPSPAASEVQAPALTSSSDALSYEAASSTVSGSEPDYDAIDQSSASADEEGFQISFDFFENGERALSGRMMDGEEHAQNFPLDGEVEASAVGEGEKGASGIAAPTSSSIDSTVSTRSPRTRQKRKRAKKRKKRTARIKKEDAESKLSLLFAPWHINASAHAERTVAHRCEENARAAEQGTEEFFGISPEEADRLLSDRSAASLVLTEQAPLVTCGQRRVLLHLDTIAMHFEAGERIDLNILKARGLIPYDTLNLKVLARGVLSKALIVCANDFEPRAVKMLLLAGGKAVKKKTKTVLNALRKKA